MIQFGCRVVLVLAFSLIYGCGKDAGQSPVSAVTPFYGSYAGTAESLGKDSGVTRDLAVVIKPWDDRGFIVEWSTVIHRKGGDKKTHHSISFYPSPREGIFASAMETNVFGKTVPFDPVLKEENPYVWASLKAQTLTITAMYVMDDGGYELQVYERSIDEEGINVDFERISNGESVAQVSATLKSTD